MTHRFKSLPLATLLLALLLAALLAAGCSSSSGGDEDGDIPDGDIPDGDIPDGDIPDGDIPDGDIPDGDIPDGDADGDDPDGDDPDGDDPDPTADVRFIHLSPTTDAVDIYADQDVKLVENLAFGQGTPFVTVPAGSYDIDIVVTGATNFDGAVNADVTLEADTSYTGVAYDAEGVPSVLALVEDLSAPAAGAIRVRAIHVADGVEDVDIWDVTDVNDPTLLYAGLGFGEAGEAAEVPAGSYTLGVDVDANGTPDLLYVLPALAEGAIVNLFAVSDETNVVNLVAQFADGTVSTIEPTEFAFVRFLNISDELGETDVFVNQSETASYTVEYLAGTGYQALVPGEIDFDFAVAGDALGDAVISLDGANLEAGKFYTLAVYNAFPIVKIPTPVPDVMVIEDDFSFPTDPTMIRVRGIHAAYGVGPMDIWDYTNLGSPFAIPELDGVVHGSVSDAFELPFAAIQLAADISDDGYPDLFFTFVAEVASEYAPRCINIFVVQDEDGIHMVAHLRNGQVIVGTGEEKSFVRVLHLTPDAPAVDVWLHPPVRNDGSFLFAGDISFGEGTQFDGITPGTYYVQLTPAGDDQSTIKTFSTPVIFAQGRIYTVYVYGSAAQISKVVDDRPQLALGYAQDSFTGLFTNTIRVRPAHTALGVGTVDIWDVASTTVPLFDDVVYGASPQTYQNIAPGTYTLALDTSAGNANFDNNWSFELPELLAGTVATLFAVKDDDLVKLVAALNDGTVAVIDPVVPVK